MNLGMILVRIGYNSGKITLMHPLSGQCSNWLKSKEVKTQMKAKIIAGILIVALIVGSIGVAVAGIDTSTGPSYPEDRCCYCDYDGEDWDCGCIGDCCLQCTCNVCGC
jgi:hypothetical protein